jgi:hypothetical protein
VTDAESGDDGVTFPNFDALPGWTATGGSDITGPGPYVSAEYAWSNGAASPGQRPILGRNNAGRQASTQVTIRADAAAPTGGSVSYPHGYDADGIVTVTTDAGTDVLSGLDPDSGRLEQGLSNLAGGNCPEPASWTVVTSADPVLNGQCARYRYRVRDRVGNEVLYTSENVVKVDTAAPSLGLILAEASPHAALTGSQIFLNTTQTGEFKVRATASDADSAIAKVSFPQRTDDSVAPYEATYAFADLNGAQTVTATDEAGNSVTASFTVTRDTQAPTGGSVDYPDGYQTTTAVTVATSDGTDAGAGIASAVLERGTATLANGVCGPFTWADAASPDTVPSGKCARYRLHVTDRVGNQTTYASSKTVKVDTTAPPAPLLTLFEDEPDEHAVGRILYYRPSADGGRFTVEAAASDPQSGIANVTFPALLGDVGGADTDDPYAHTYSFASGTTASAMGVVAAQNGAGVVSATAAFDLKPDAAPPAGVTISYPNGYVDGGLVTIDVSNGTDLLSRIDPATAVLERQTAPLSGVVCGAFGEWIATADSSADVLAPNTCARYRYRISDHVGNETVQTSTNIAKFDGLPPAPVSAATATAGDHHVTVRWTPPPDGDFEAVRIVRKQSGAAPIQVYVGAGTSFRDTSLTNGVKYTYELTSSDESGNRSSVVAVAAVPTNPYLVSPKDGAVVSRPPLLDWRPKAQATYYNVQLWRSGVKILSRHPTRSQFALRSTWTYAGRTYRLGAGRYKWLVWPGFGQPSAARFGKLLGWSEFTKRS